MGYRCRDCDRLATKVVTGGGSHVKYLMCDEHYSAYELAMTSIRPVAEALVRHCGLTAGDTVMRGRCADCKEGSDRSDDSPGCKVVVLRVRRAKKRGENHGPVVRVCKDCLEPRDELWPN